MTENWFFIAFRLFCELIWIISAAVILLTLSSVDFFAHALRRKRRDVFKQSDFIRRLRWGVFGLALGGSVSIVVGFFQPIPAAISLKDEKRLRLIDLKGKKIVEDFYGDIVVIPENGILESEKILFEKANYSIHIVTNSPRVLGETARIKLYIGYKLVEEYKCSQEYSEKIIKYESTKKQYKSIKIGLANAYYDLKNLFRYLRIKSILIKKET